MPEHFSASAAPTGMPGPAPMAPPASEPKNSSGWRNGQHAPFHDNGRWESETRRSPTASRNAYAKSSVVILPSGAGLGTATGWRFGVRDALSDATSYGPSCGPSRGPIASSNAGTATSGWAAMKTSTGGNP